MGCWESEWTHLGPKCAACGGLQNITDPEERAEADARVRARRGCDGPPKYPLELRMGNEALTLNECPSRSLSEVTEAFEVHGWAERGRLQYLYPFDELPAILGEALNVIEAELMAREKYAHEKAMRRQGG